MESIIRYIGDLRLSRNFFTLPRLRFIPILSTPELVMLSFMTAFGSFYLMSSEKPVDFDRWRLLPAPLSSEAGAENSDNSVMGSGVEQFRDANMDMISDLKDRYSFKNASLGFFISDLSFLEQGRMESAEERFTQMLPTYMRARAKQYVRPVLLLSEKHQIDPFWVMSIMWTESHFEPKAESHVGAKGLMQLMPKTKAWIYNRYRNKGNRLVVENQMTNIGFFFNKKIEKPSLHFYKMKLINIELGIVYLKYLLNRFDQSHKLATVAYNMGPGWTRYRLRNKLPVGTKNLYLNKVRKAYAFLSREI